MLNNNFFLKIIFDINFKKKKILFFIFLNIKIEKNIKNNLIKENFLDQNWLLVIIGNV